MTCVVQLKKKTNHKITSQQTNFLSQCALHIVQGIT